MNDIPEWYVTETNHNTLEVFDTIKNEIICGIYGGKTIGEQYEIASRIANLPDLERQRDTAIAERDAWKAKFIQQNKDLGCEMMDPNGTIWDYAKKLQKDLDAAIAERDELKRTNDGL